MSRPPNSAQSGLPPGVRIGSATGENGRPVVRIDLTAMTQPSDGKCWPEGNSAAPVTAAVIMSARGARAAALALLAEADRIDRAIWPSRVLP